MILESPLSYPLYTVGPATSRALNALLFKSQILRSYSSSVEGADTGNGENLAKYILSHYNSLCSQPEAASARTKLPLLFLVGEQRRDIIPKILTSSDLPLEERISIDELVVYETGIMESFPHDLDSHIARCRLQGSKVVSIVVFSPSGCEAMLQCLGYVDSNGKLTEAGQNRARWQRRDIASETDAGGGEAVIREEAWTQTNYPKFCIASIGPTTREYLYKTWSFEVDVCAEKPSPECVGTGISLFLKEQNLL